MRQFAAEGLVLAVVAAAIGAGLAVGGVRLLVALAPADIPRIADAAVDVRVLTITLFVAIGAGLLFGMVPALQARRVDLQGSLKGEGGHGGSAGGERTRLRSVLVVAECALAVMLVIGATLLIKSFWRIQHVDAGFQSAGVLKAEYQLPATRYPVDFRRWPNFEEMHAFSTACCDGRAAPGCGRRRGLRLSPARSRLHELVPHHRPRSGGGDAAGDLGQARDARLLPDDGGSAGPRARADRRGHTSAPPVLLINQAAAHRFFDGQDPLGKQMSFWGATRTIVGVVGNERFQGLAEAAPIAVYAPLDQAPSANGGGVLLVRTSGDPKALIASVRGVIREQDPALAVFGLEPFAETVSRSVAERRFTMLVLGLLASVALLLAAIGVHGVLSYSVAARTREIGIRMALGAQPSGVSRLVVSQGMTLALTGAVVGVAAALLLTRSMGTLLFGVTPTDPFTFVVVPLGLALVALLASYLPARRATRVDPVTALRAD